MARPKDVDDEEIIDAIDQADSEHVSTTDLAEKFGFTNNGIHGRLERLEEENRVQSKRVGRTDMWKVISAEIDPADTPDVTDSADSKEGDRRDALTEYLDRWKEQPEEELYSLGGSLLRVSGYLMVVFIAVLLANLDIPIRPDVLLVSAILAALLGSLFRLPKIYNIGKVALQEIVSRI